MKFLKTIVIIAIILLPKSILYSDTGWLDIKPSGLNINLSSTTFVDKDTGYAVGGSTAGLGVFIKTTDGGNNWTVTEYDRFLLNDIICLSNGYLVMVGSSLADTCGVMLKSSNGGAGWDTLLFNGINYPKSLSLTSVTATGSSNIFATSSNGTILISTDGGSSWIKAQTNTQSDLFSDIFFPSKLVGYATSGSNEDIRSTNIYKTTDQGLTWDKIIDLGQFFNISSIFFLDDTTGFVSGSRYENEIISKTTDGGTTWNPVYQGLKDNSIKSMSFFDSKNGFACGTYSSATGGRAFRTSDGGNSFKPEHTGYSATLYDICYVDLNHAYAVGSDGTVLKYYSEVSVHGDIAPGNINFMPNPFSYILTISLQGAFTGKEIKLRLYDSFGNRVYETTEIGNKYVSLDLSRLSSGIYFIEASDGKRLLKTHKAIKY